MQNLFHLLEKKKQKTNRWATIQRSGFLFCSFVSSVKYTKNTDGWKKWKEKSKRSVLVSSLNLYWGGGWTPFFQKLFPCSVFRWWRCSVGLGSAVKWLWRRCSVIFILLPCISNVSPPIYSGFWLLSVYLRICCHFKRVSVFRQRLRYKHLGILDFRYSKTAVKNQYSSWPWF